MREGAKAPGICRRPETWGGGADHGVMSGEKQQTWRGPGQSSGYSRGQGSAREGERRKDETDREEADDGTLFLF